MSDAEMELRLCPGYSCPEGSETPKHTECGAANVYCPAGTAVPTPVSAGMLGLGQTVTTQTQQVSCPAGTVLPCLPQRYDLAPTVTYPLVPSCASPGFVCSGGVKTPCPAGYACAGNSVQTDCGSVAVFCPSGSASPVPASFGHYTVGGTSVSTQSGQVLCEPGYQCSGGVKTTCEAGAVSASGSDACTPCPTGQRAAGAGCEPCPIGSYNDLQKQTSCKACPPGTYTAAAGSVACFPCPTGTYNPDSQGASLLSCRRCPDSMTTRSPGSTSVVACIPNPTFVLVNGQATPCGDSFNCSQGVMSVQELQLRPGWWRSVNSTMNARKCVSEQHCTGGKLYDDPDALCGEGHSGRCVADCLRSRVLRCTSASGTVSANCVCVRARPVSARFVGRITIAAARCVCGAPTTQLRRLRWQCCCLWLFLAQLVPCYGMVPCVARITDENAR